MSGAPGDGEELPPTAPRRIDILYVPRVTCPRCGSGLVRKNGLRRAKATQHFKCERCLESFKMQIKTLDSSKIAAAVQAAQDMPL